MKSPLISVIIPLYNAERFLKRSIESVLNQTYRNLEIILINDGSSDWGGIICERYAKQDKRIKYVSQENKGLCASRHVGLGLATGEYVAFIDADDYVLPQMYETMVHSIEEAKADVCICQWNYEIPDGRHTIDKSNILKELYGVHYSTEFVHNFLYKPNPCGYYNGVVVAPWNKLYKKNIIADVVFSARIGEDEDMNDSVFCKNCKVVVIPNEFYFWCQNLLSISNSPFNANRLDFLDMLQRRKSKYKNDNYLVKETEKLYCNMFIEYYYKAKKISFKLSSHQKSAFRKNCYSLLVSRYCNLKFYLRMLLFTLSPRLYKKTLMR